MGDMSPKERIKALSPEDYDKFQSKLNALCEQHNINTFSLNAKRGQWKKLILEILEVPGTTNNSYGRKVEDIEDKGQVCYAYSEILTEMTYNNKKVKRTRIYDVIKERLYNKGLVSFRNAEPIAQIRNIVEKHSPKYWKAYFEDEPDIPISDDEFEDLLKK